MKLCYITKKAERNFHEFRCWVSSKGCNKTIPVLKTQAHAYEWNLIHGKPREPQHTFQSDHPHFNCNFPLSTATWRTCPQHEMSIMQHEDEQCKFSSKFSALYCDIFWYILVEFYESTDTFNRGKRGRAQSCFEKNPNIVATQKYATGPATHRDLLLSLNKTLNCFWKICVSVFY